MKTLSCTAPGFLEFGEAAMPLPAADNVLIKVKKIGVCGTDLHAFEGTQPFFEYPRILGHELSGELMESIDGTGFHKGEAVTFMPYFNCGNCVACRAGLTNCCVHLKVFGVHIDGGMKQYISVPVDKLLHGESLSFEELALAEPLAIGAHAIRRAAVQPGEYVVVVGAGPIGLGIMEFARMAGAIVIAVDVNRSRLNFSRHNACAAFSILSLTENAIEAVREITRGDMATVVIDATGNLPAIDRGIYYLAHGGRYVLVGLQKQAFSFNHPEFHKREATLMSSRNATRTDFEQVITAMQNKQVQPLQYITHRVHFDAIKDHFAGWLAPESGVIKAMIGMDD